MPSNRSPGAPRSRPLFALWTLTWDGNGVFLIPYPRSRRVLWFRGDGMTRSLPNYLAPESTDGALGIRLHQQPQCVFHHSLLGPNAATSHRLTHQPIVDFNTGPHSLSIVPIREHMSSLRFIQQLPRNCRHQLAWTESNRLCHQPISEPRDHQRLAGH